MINNNFIYTALVEAYPEDAKALFQLCKHGLEQPLGIDHPLIVQDLIGVNLGQSELEKIQLAYVMITAYYFLLDAVVDKHLKKNLDSLYLTHFLALSCELFNDHIYSNQHINIADFKRSFHQLISENAKAIRTENEFSSNLLSYSEQKEYDSIVGRSNSSIILLEIIAVISNSRNIDDVKEILKDFAFFVQLGDDLADWRDDLRAGNYTSFLRELFSKYNRILTEDELDEEIYLSNVFEARAVKIVKGLSQIIIRIEKRDNNKGKYLKLLIHNQIEKIKTLMVQVVEIKLKQ